jgi:hypothetical protein
MGYSVCQEQKSQLLRKNEPPRAVVPPALKHTVTSALSLWDQTKPDLVWCRSVVATIGRATKAALCNHYGVVARCAAARYAAVAHQSALLGRIAVAGDSQCDCGAQRVALTIDTEGFRSLYRGALPWMVHEVSLFDRT